MPPLTTAKAYASAICSGVALVLSETLPFVGDADPWGRVIAVVLAVLAAYGITYAVPNAPQGPQSRHGRTRTLDDVVDDVLGPPADGAPTP